MSTASQVSKLYRTVVEDVINNVKDAFLDEGVDEQVLQELKQLWESKLASSKALEPAPIEVDVSVTPQNVPIILPQPISSATQQRPVLAQGTQVQPSTQFQVSQTTPAAATATLALPSGLFQQQLTAIGAGGQLQNITVQPTGNGQYIAVPSLPGHQLPHFQQQLQQLSQPGATAGVVQQQHILPQQQQQQPKLVPAGSIVQQNQTTVPSQLNKSQGGIHQSVVQLDGNGDTSSSENEDFDDDDKDDDEKEEENEEEDQGEEEEPLNSGDDVSEDDPTDLFDTDNVVVCQFDKINRNKNKWKFQLKDGIMNLDGRDFVFQRAIGDSEW